MSHRVRPTVAVALLLACSVSACERSDAPPSLDLAHWTWSADGERTRDIELPTQPGDWLPNRPAVYRIETTVELPVRFRGRELSVAVNRLAGRAWATSDGVPLTSIQAPPLGNRSRQGYAWRIPTVPRSADTVSIEIAVSHEWTQSGWLDTVPRLIAGPRADPGYWFVRDFNHATALGAFAVSLLMGVSNFLVWLTGRRQRAALWLSVQALAGSIYPLVVSGHGEWLWGQYEPLVAGNSLVLSAVASIYFSAKQFEFSPPARAWWALPSGVAIGSLLFLDPFESTQFIIVAVVGSLVTICGHHVRFFLISQRQRSRFRVPIALTSLAWPLAAVIATVDCVAWLGMGELMNGLRPGPLGITIIAVLEAIMLSVGFVDALRTADDLNGQLSVQLAELNQNQSEVEALNRELRRQIQQRAEPLLQRLVRLSRDPGMHTLAPGDRVASRYLLQSELGKGAMGQVFVAERIQDRRQVALKVITGHPNSYDKARFMREALAISLIESPHVVGIVDVDVTEDGTLFCAMELVAGTSLRGRRTELFTPRYRVLHQIALGLEAIHGAGIVHRDIKPANVIVSAPGDHPLRAVIVDFGIAKSEARALAPPVSELATHPMPRPSGDSALGGDTAVTRELAAFSSRSDVTRAGHLVGTPRYMAPELAFGVTKSAADVFAFGVLAYELLHDTPAFERPPVFAAANSESKSCEVSDWSWDIPAPLRELLERALSDDELDRPSSAELAAALQTAVQPDPTGSSR